MTSLITKARKPKFDLHLKIYDLNNVPLVSGVSLIKWHLPHSIHGEHRGRTSKCPIANHRVEYGYSKLVPLRIAIDRNNNLAECLIEFDVLQEFNLGGGGSGVSGRDEKINLGTVRLNLSEYVEESEAILRDGTTATAFRASITSPGPGDRSTHHRKRSSLSGITVGGPDTSPRSSHRSEPEDDPGTVDVQEGVVRRYLMQESKINSTLKISILMVQVDGERNYIAPPLRTAPVFGGIAGIVAGGDALEHPDATPDASGQVPSLSNKSRDIFELQDAYRRVLAASWASQPGELPADQCIEDIFAGGDGFRADPYPPQPHHSPPTSAPATATTMGLSATTNRTPSTGSLTNHMSAPPREDSGSTSGDDYGGDTMGTLRPRDMAKLRLHMRAHSGLSDQSSGTIVGVSGGERDRESGGRGIGVRRNPSHRDLLRRMEGGGGKDDADGSGLRNRSDSVGSLASLATTLGSDRLRDHSGFKRAREVDEFDVRDDLVAWAVAEAH
ncbi:N-terminal C2 in EEIG1 and EHBP1 proteins-domain-containing protein [Cercophora scortea]|uniref:N-terminal C2 in EEIG1 and EHBP1 proteins-domain-containing protein n=1 Tax=Cercophora scortea TaxID=314031 RepID=A0AAE0J5F5_9PEZI|nr:N-terminal C2 in EEIG1 and EHBP1 proteins-domain-containing protein [Cercophora scortea]